MIKINAMHGGDNFNDAKWFTELEKHAAMFGTVHNVVITCDADRVITIYPDTHPDLEDEHGEDWDEAFYDLVEKIKYAYDLVILPGLEMGCTSYYVIDADVDWD